MAFSTPSPPHHHHHYHANSLHNDTHDRIYNDYPHAPTPHLTPNDNLHNVIVIMFIIDLINDINISICDIINVIINNVIIKPSIYNIYVDCMYIYALGIILSYQENTLNICIY